MTDETHDAAAAEAVAAETDTKAADTAESGVGMKTLGAFQVGDEATGEVTAVVATLGEVDHDGEIIAPDAIPNGMKVIMSDYNHSSVKGQLLGTGLPDTAPVGKGAIHIEGNKAVYRGQYFMETQRGKEAFLTTKAMGPDAKWSFAYGIQKTAAPSAEMKAKGARRVLVRIGSLPGDAGMEVSPVNMPGGVGTQTVSLKDATPKPTETIEPPAPSGDDLILEQRIARVKRSIR